MNSKQRRVATRKLIRDWPPGTRVMWGAWGRPQIACTVVGDGVFFGTLVIKADCGTVPNRPSQFGGVSPKQLTRVTK